MRNPNLAILQPDRRAGIRPMPIPRQYDQDWIKTRSNFLWTCPCYSHILYKMLVPDGQEHCAVFTDEVPVAATDGLALYLHYENFFKNYKLHQRVFILGHEVLHVMLNHPNLCHIYQQNGGIKYPDGEFLPYDHKLMGIAMDYGINALLVADNIGTKPDDAHYDLNIATPESHHTETYRKLFKIAVQQGQRPGRPCPDGPPGAGGQGQPQPGQGQPQPGGNCPVSGKPSFDQLLKPGSGQGKDPHQTSKERNEPEWKAAIAGGIASSRSQGKEASALERLIKEIMEPSIEWQDHVEMFFARKIGTNGYDWRRPDRRWITRSQPIFVPAMSGFGAECIVACGDSSGSVDDRHTGMWLGELAGMLESLRPRRLVFMWCDAKVHGVYEIEDPADIAHLRSKGAQGGGGTDFRPVFDKIKEMDLEPDALIYLTDGLGRFPRTAPNYPTLWGSTYLKKEGYPFGDVVMLPKLD